MRIRKRGNILDLIVMAVIAVVLIAAARRIVTGVGRFYEMGYSLVSQKALDSEGQGKTITIEVTPGMTVTQVGDLLESESLIASSRVFVFQERMSSFSGMIQPGTYEISSEMTTDQILQVLSGQAPEDE